MKNISKLLLTCLVAGITCAHALTGWSESASYIIGTTEDWASLPDSAMELNFPLLVRLHSSSFDFSETEDDGADIRFTREDPEIILDHEIEYWNADSGMAAIWVKIDTIRGNELKVIKLWWGNSSAVSTSSGPAVFNMTDNFLGGVYHFSPPAAFDDASDAGNNGTNMGTVEADGIIGKARYFDHTTIVLDSSVTDILGVGEGTMSFWLKTDTTINGGTQWNANCFLGSDSPLTADTWWGSLDNGLIGMSPSSSTAMLSTSRVDNDVWHHVTMTRRAVDGHVQTFVDGVLEAEGPLHRGDMFNNILNTFGRSIHGKTDSGYVIGNWDEVRIVDTVRSESWVKLSYESQKALPTLVSQPIVTGCKDDFSVAVSSVTMNEGEMTTIEAKADCALLAKWSKVLDGDSLVPVPTAGMNAIVQPGRVAGDQTETFRFSGLYIKNNGDTTWNTEDVTVNITESIPDPEFTISIPSDWDGLSALLLAPEITNLDDINATSATQIMTVWRIAGVVVTANDQFVFGDVTADSMLLTQPKNNGTLNIIVCLDNGGADVCDTSDVVVTKKDPFVLDTANTGDSIELGTNFNWAWSTNAPDADYVTLEYFTGFTRMPIDSVENTGTYTWAVPNSITVYGGTIKLRLTDPSSLTYIEFERPVKEVGIVQRQSGGGLSFQIKGGRTLSLKAGDYNRVEIIDARGKMINTLSLNSNEFYWNSTDKSGQAVDPGFYLVHFLGKMSRQQHKVVIMN